MFNMFHTVVTFSCSIIDQQQKQTIAFAGARCMGEFDGRIYITTARDVYQLVAIPVEKQVSCGGAHYRNNLLQAWFNWTWFN